MAVAGRVMHTVHVRPASTTGCRHTCVAPNRLVTALFRFRVHLQRQWANVNQRTVAMRDDPGNPTSPEDESNARSEAEPAIAPLRHTSELLIPTAGRWFRCTAHGESMGTRCEAARYVVDQMEAGTTQGDLTTCGPDFRDGRHRSA